MWENGKEIKPGEKNEEFHLKYNNLQMTGFDAEMARNYLILEN